MPLNQIGAGEQPKPQPDCLVITLLYPRLMIDWFLNSN
jgi:hypothetical protein